MKRKSGFNLKFLVGLLVVSLIVCLGFAFVSNTNGDSPNYFGITKEQAFALIALVLVTLLLLSPLLYVRSKHYKGPWSKHQREPMLVEKGQTRLPLVQQGKRSVVEVDRLNETILTIDEDEEAGNAGRNRK